MSRGIGYGYGYHGNLHIKCWHCGSEKTLHINRELEVFDCPVCSKRTRLENMRLAFIHCECGNDDKYLTNCRRMFEIECYVCGQPVAMVPMRRRKDKKTIYVSTFFMEEQKNKLRGKK